MPIVFSPVRSGAFSALDLAASVSASAAPARAAVERGDRLIADHHRRHRLVVEVGDLAGARQLALAQHA